MFELEILPSGELDAPNRYVIATSQTSEKTLWLDAYKSLVKLTIKSKNIEDITISAAIPDDDEAQERATPASPQKVETETDFKSRFQTLENQLEVSGLKINDLNFRMEEKNRQILDRDNRLASATNSAKEASDREAKLSEQVGNLVAKEAAYCNEIDGLKALVANFERLEPIKAAELLICQTKLEEICNDPEYSPEKIAAMKLQLTDLQKSDLKQKLNINSLMDANMQLEKERNSLFEDSLNLRSELTKFETLLREEEASADQLRQQLKASGDMVLSLKKNVTSLEESLNSTDLSRRQRQDALEIIEGKYHTQQKLVLLLESQVEEGLSFLHLRENDIKNLNLVAANKDIAMQNIESLLSQSNLKVLQKDNTVKELEAAIHSLTQSLKDKVKLHHSGVLAREAKAKVRRP